MTYLTARVVMMIIWLASLGATVFFGVREDFATMVVFSAVSLGACVGGMIAALRKW